MFFKTSLWIFGHPHVDVILFEAFDRVDEKFSHNKKCLKTKKAHISVSLSTQSRSRTGTSVTSLVFETNASTNSAIWALQYFKLQLIGVETNAPAYRQAGLPIPPLGHGTRLIVSDFCFRSLLNGLQI